MKNKKLLYILIPLVAVVWGLIIWKVVAFRPEQQLPYANQLPQEEQPADTSRYELKINYQDPFLRSARNSGTSPALSSTKKANNIKKVKINSLKGPVKPEGLIYRGVITCNNERVGLLEVSGQKRLIKEHTQVEEYHIVAVEMDSLRINFMEKEYVYGKQ
jgi:hypothetical protein